MPYQEVTFTREVLYEQVWERPVTQLAKEYGISDVAVAKMCRKLNVPVPPRGYWARVTAGHKPKRPPLPPVGESAPVRHLVRRWHGPEGATASAVDARDAPAIPVPAILESPHRLIRQCRTYLQCAAKEYDPKHRPAEEVLDVAVSETAADRALRIIDALIKALESRRHSVEIREVKQEPRQYYGSEPSRGAARWHTFALIDTTAVEFGLEEAFETIEIPPLAAFRPPGDPFLDAPVTRQGADAERKAHPRHSEHVG